jgi:Mrp family chromosome partitioning ATPase
VVATAIVGVLLKTPLYEAKVKMLISGQKHTQAEYYTDIGFGGIRSDQITMTQSEIVTSDPVLERAVSVLGLMKKPLDYEKRFSSKLKKPFVNLQVRNTEKRLEKLPKEQREAFLFRLAVEDLRQRLKVTPVRDTDLFLIKVQDYNPLGAAVMANVVSRSYVMFDLEQQLAEMQLKYGEKNPAVIQVKEAIEKMNKSLNGTLLSPMEAIGPASVKVIDQAKVPLKPTGISRTLTVVLAFFMSIFFGVMFAFSFEYMDQTFRSPREAESFLGIDCLGSLPRRAKNDDYQDLSERLYTAIKNKGARSVLFTSALPYEGVTAIILNLGKYIAENLQKKVLLIDGNLRNPTLHKMFKLPETHDLINIIEGKLTLEKGVRSISQNLHVLTSGASTGPRPGKMKRFVALVMKKTLLPTVLFSPVAVLESNMKRELLKQAGDIYDLLIINTTPLAKHRYAAINSTFRDRVVLVANERKTRRHVVKHALGSLKACKANILGLVLNDREYVIPKMIYDRV